MLYDLEIAKKITGITDEQILQFYIDAIIDKINNILGYDIKKHVHSEYITGVNKNYVYVTARPINQILEIKKDDFDLTKYSSILSSRKILLPIEICNQHKIFAKYDAGYEQLPPSIQLFIFEQLKDAISEMNSAGLKSYSIETISYTYVDKQTKTTNFINDVKNLFGGL